MELGLTASFALLGFFVALGGGAMKRFETARGVGGTGPSSALRSVMIDDCASTLRSAANAVKKDFGPSQVVSAVVTGLPSSSMRSSAAAPKAAMAAFWKGAGERRRGRVARKRIVVTSFSRASTLFCPSSGRGLVASSFSTTATSESEFVAAGAEAEAEVVVVGAGWRARVACSQATSLGRESSVVALMAES